MKVHRLPLGKGILTTSTKRRITPPGYHSAWSRAILGEALTLHFRPRATVEVSTASRRKEATMRDWICFIETFYARIVDSQESGAASPVLRLSCLGRSYLGRYQAVHCALVATD